MRYTKGIMWLDDCRIPFVDDGENKLVFHRSGKGGYRKEFVGCEIKEQYKWDKPQGRFTPNLLVCDDMLNDGKISVSEGGKTTRDTAHFGGGTFKMEGYGDKGSNSRYYDLDMWFNKMIDEI